MIPSEVLVGNTEKFEMIANAYDTPERIRIAKISADAIRGDLLKHGIDTKDMDAIDFGCGTGLVGIGLLDCFRSVLFLDTSESMICRVEEKLRSSDVRNAGTLCYDLEKESLSDLRADCIFMAQVLLHIQDTEVILSRLYDILHEGGQLLIVDFDRNEQIVSDLVHHGFDQHELTCILRSIGYKRVHANTIHSGSKIFMGQDASMFVMGAGK